MSEKKFDPKKLIKYKFKAAESLKNVLKAKPSVSVPQKRQSPIRSLWDNLLLMIIAVLLAFCLRTFLAQVAYISADSMEPTLKEGDRILINKLAYGIANPFWGISETKKLFFFLPNPLYGHKMSVSRARYLIRLKRDPKRGDIIAFRYPARKGEEQNDMVKRIIGLPGEQVKIKKGKVFINGRPLAEKYRLIKDNYDFAPVKVPYGSYYVIGDNRTASSDSRYWGALSGNDIIGVMQITVWPPKK